VSADTETPPILRSILFVPGDRSALLAKVSRWNPDLVVLDLEDAVAPAQKAAARADLARALGTVSGVRTAVRINAIGTPWFEEDLAAAAACGSDWVVLPKAEELGTVQEVRDTLLRSADSARLMLGIESAQGVAAARQLLSVDRVAAYFGAEDFIADMGGRRTPAGGEVLYARSEVALAGRLNAAVVIDQAVVAYEDDARFIEDAACGRDLGYAGKLCVHPRQVTLAHQAFSPSDAEVDEARRVLALADLGAVSSNGEMVDAVHVRMARRVLEVAEATAADVPVRQGALDA
jgi:citrate lyase subunit beta/citryl-CoA lyase